MAGVEMSESAGEATSGVEVWSKLEERRRGRSVVDSRERRSALRYPVSRCTVRLQWRSEVGWVVGDGELLEIGMGGTSLVVDGEPVVGRPVEMWLASEGSAGKFSGEVLECVREVEGMFRVRVVFPDGCPYELFKRLVWGSG